VFWTGSGTMLLLSLLIKFYLVQEIDYVQKAELAWDQAWQILHTEDGWRKESGSSIESGIVYSRYFKHIGKLFKLEVHIIWSDTDVKSTLLDL